MIPIINWSAASFWQGPCLVTQGALEKGGAGPVPTGGGFINVVIMPGSVTCAICFTQIDDTAGLGAGQPVQKNWRWNEKNWQLGYIVVNSG